MGQCWSVFQEWAKCGLYLKSITRKWETGGYSWFGQSSHKLEVMGSKKGLNLHHFCCWTSSCELWLDHRGSAHVQSHLGWLITAGLGRQLFAGISQGTPDVRAPQGGLRETWQSAEPQQAAGLSDPSCWKARSEQVWRFCVDATDPNRSSGTAVSMRAASAGAQRAQRGVVI